MRETLAYLAINSNLFRVPLSDERRYSMSPLFHTHYVPDIVRCVPPFREISILEPREITLPEAKDKVILI